MPTRTLLVLLAAVCLRAQTPAIPDTPAGRVLSAWLDAFNSGDKGRLQAYLAEHDRSNSLDRMMAFRDQTGGFELIGIGKSEPLRIEFRVKEKGSPTVGAGMLSVKESSPGEVAEFDLRAIPPGVTEADLTRKIDPATRARVVEGAAAKLDEYYVFPEAAKKMGELIRTRLKEGAYDRIDDAGEFARTLTSDLRSVSHDKHLRVGFNPAPIPKEQPKPDQAREREEMERMNCAFDKVERLPSNIGYVKFDGFMDPAICGATAAAAMNFIAHTGALIIDLRENGGGEPSMVAFISSYLFDEPTHLNDLYDRKENTTSQYWTLPYVPGARFGMKPVFVLTSKHTFSGAEEFCYNLKNLKRATIIGETTGGGAHPVSGHRIDDHFMIGVPFARAVNPISKTNWEGTGVEPDVKAPADEALSVAQKMATDAVRKKGK